MGLADGMAWEKECGWQEKINNAKTDNMRVQFNIVIPQGINPSSFNPIDKPIIDANGNPIGIITEAELDDSEQWYSCKGIIWDRFIGYQLRSDKTDFNCLVLE